MIYYITPDRWESIPDDSKFEHSNRHGGKACFLPFLTSVCNKPETTLLYEKFHFIVTDRRPEHTDAQRTNGNFAVQCLTEKAQEGFHLADNLTIWEYFGTTSDRLARWILYAYQYGDEYANDLTADELVDFLEALRDKLDRETRTAAL